MDFWDLTVVIFRRWKVSLPLLLITIAGAAFLAFTMKPDYTMTSYVQLIPAKVAPSDNPVNASSRNPWNQLGLNTLGQATIYATQDKKFLDGLKAGKHTDNFTLTLTYPDPIITVEVVGTGPEDARETTQLVVDRLEESAQSLQAGSGVSRDDMIITKRLDQGQNLLPSTSKVKRAVIAVAAAGMVLTAGGTVAFDALARRRSRKRGERQRAESPQENPETETSTGEPETETSTGEKVRWSPEETMVTSGPANHPQAGVPPENRAEPPVAPLPRAAPSPGMERTAILANLAAKVVKRPPAATYRSAYAQGPVNGEDHEAKPGANGGSLADPSDVRVVLQPKWFGGENGGKSS